MYADVDRTRSILTWYRDGECGESHVHILIHVKSYEHILIYIDTDLDIDLGDR